MARGSVLEGIREQDFSRTEFSRPDLGPTGADTGRGGGDSRKLTPLASESFGSRSFGVSEIAGYDRK